MAESVYKVIELVGTSTESWELAAKAAVERAGQGLRDLRVAEVAHSGDIDQPFRRIAISHSGRSRAVWRGARDGAVGHVG